MSAPAAAPAAAAAATAAAVAEKDHRAPAPVDSAEVKAFLASLSAADQRTVAQFREFLRIPTMSSDGPKGSYQQAAKWLLAYAVDVGLDARIVELRAGLPIVVATWKGARPELPTLLLNSHYDVVPVYAQYWQWPAFGAAMDAQGNIYARGTQDMKCVCIMYLEAMRRLIAAQKAGTMKPFTRTIHLTFMPDEELGGNGMQPFIAAEWLTAKHLNVAVALDEGIANPTDKFTVFYGERALWWLHVKAVGNTGHASRFVEKTATEKLLRAVNKFLQFRSEQQALLNPKPAATVAAGADAKAATAPAAGAHDAHAGCAHAAAKKLGDVVTLNLTMLRAGVTHNNGASYALNVVPGDAEAGFDLRIPPHVDLKEFEAKIREWTSEEGVSFEWIIHADRHAVSPIVSGTTASGAAAADAAATKQQNAPFYKAMLNALAEQKLSIEPEIFPAATDGRFVRLENIPVYGFSPINHTPVLLHDHNELLNAKVLCRGVDVYVGLLPALANEMANDK